MRELRFRAWDGKKMFVPAYISSYGHAYETDRDVENDRYFHHVVIMQWTGLKDKNGVDIYEGDIVKWRSTFKGAKGNEHIDAIEWQNNHACFLLMPHVHEPYAAEMEVIGNIYQHKHLLK